jgi:hypothetical protein
MTAVNLVNAYTQYEDLQHQGIEPEGPLKPHEIQNLHDLCTCMINQGCTKKDFNGYYIGYSIKQIGKEFDLLKFTKASILNIELKTELMMEDKEEKILRQMRTNHYYLNAITSQIIIMTFVEKDGFYLYHPDTDSLQKISSSAAAVYIKQTEEDPSFDPDRKFIPSNYLISPYNDTEKFLRDAYFLTTAQNAIKKEILALYQTKEYRLYTLQASTGTGKTLLLYDIAKEMMKQGQKVRILHTQALNPGQEELIQKYHWDICSIDDTKLDVFFQGIQFLCIDEAQLLSEAQIRQVLSLSIQTQIPVLFCYDPKQEQFRTSSFDIDQYITKAEPEIKLYQSRLTNKIRTNKEMADFLDEMMQLNHDHPVPPDHNIIITYIPDQQSLEQEIDGSKKDDYTVLDLSSLSIPQMTGQEYKKALLVLDSSFYYDHEKLHSTKHQEEVLYEVMTRVIDQLKILVYQNKDLYQTLMRISTPA